MQKIILSLILALPLQAANPLTQFEKNRFVDFYRDRMKLNSESPKYRWMNVMFTDLDGDGLVDALASDALSTYAQGYAIWIAYKNTGDQWIPCKEIGQTSKKIEENGAVSARSGEFFRVVKNNGAIQFLILRKYFDRELPNGRSKLKKYWFILDKENVLRKHRIDDLEEYFSYDAIMDPSAVISMEQIKVEEFGRSKEKTK